MSEHRIDTWLGFQTRMVTPDGSTAVRVQLEGPNEDTVGTWPIELGEGPALGEIIRAVLDAYASELPRGAHRMRLVAFDGQGRQVSHFPLTAQGHSSAALAAGHEEKARQQARAIEVANWEAQSLSFRNALQAADLRNEKLETRLAEAYERNSQLLEAVLNMQASRLDDEAKQKESEARAEAWREVASTAKPLLEALMPVLAIKIAAALGGELAPANALPASSPSSPSSSTDNPTPETLPAAETAGVIDAAPTAEGPRDPQPDHDAVDDRNRAAEGASPDGASGGKGNRRSPARGSRSQASGGRRTRK